MKFVPSNDYSGLLKQANALYALIVSMESRLTIEMDARHRAEARLALIDDAEVAAERHTNALLTDALQRAEDRISELEQSNVAHQRRSVAESAACVCYVPL